MNTINILKIYLLYNKLLNIKENEIDFEIEKVEKLIKLIGPEFEIFENMFSDYDHFLSTGAKFRAEMLIEELEQKRKLMGNARDIRTLFEKTVRNQAIRLAKVENPDRVMLREIAAEDILEESSLDGMGR